MDRASERPDQTRSPAAGRPGGVSKGTATRARVLDAAAHVLATHGYAGTRLAEVARHAGVQAPAIYYHFASREDLIEEVMAVGIAQLADAVDEAVAAVPDAAALDRIDAAVAAHLRFELTESDYARAAIRNAEQAPEPLRRRYREGARRYDHLWADLVAAAGVEGALRDDLDATTARFLVLGALTWSSEWWTPRRGSITAVVAQAQAFVRAGLTPD